ncbi:Histone-lysine N-methyltransferase set9 [Clydaea vesicula]|uniref:Histone-lysine N-methyltransferase set9 n=1 Tax=Clydaea vesicula TaxID=447962 RepID=A0AAD5U1Y0_9FUNG|nr:Histone-lysine N-methyltransferase set9 [Clydaea vesicula]
MFGGKKQTAWRKQSDDLDLENHYLLSLSDLSQYDDICCELLLDTLFLGFKTHKMKSIDSEEKYEIWFTAERQLLAEATIQVLKKRLVPTKELIQGEAQNYKKLEKLCVEDSMNCLLKLFTGEIPFDELEFTYNFNFIFRFTVPCETFIDQISQITHPFKNFLSSLNEKKTQDFKNHFEKYIKMYSPSAGFELARTYRYCNSDKVEACLIATKEWKKGDHMQFCSALGSICALTAEEEQDLENSDFSLIYSTKYNITSLFLGPARFTNHDCNPNFIPSDNGTIRFCVIADINVGEEILLSYGPNYFGYNNGECLCATCELHQKGAFANEFFNSPKRKTSCRTNNFNFRDNVLKVFKKPVVKKIEDGECYSCSVKLTQDQQDNPELLLPSSLFNIRRNQFKKCCSRCYRHFRIFNSLWPDHNQEAKVSLNPIHSLDLHHYVDIPLGVEISDVNIPQIVWVIPQVTNTLYWPAILIPREFCVHEKSLNRLVQKSEQNSIIVLFLSSPPTIGETIKEDIVEFDQSSELFKFFSKHFPSNFNSDVKIALDLINHCKFPTEKKWKTFMPVFDALVKQHPNFIDTSKLEAIPKGQEIGRMQYSEVPGLSVKGVNMFQLVWVNPHKKGIWWSALAVSDEICKKFKLETKEHTNLENSAGRVPLSEMKVFDQHSDPFKFFLNLDPTLINKKNLKNPMDLIQGNLKGKSWSSFQKIFDSYLVFNAAITAAQTCKSSEVEKSPLFSSSLSTVANILKNGESENFESELIKNDDKLVHVDDFENSNEIVVEDSNFDMLEAKTDAQELFCAVKEKTFYTKKIESFLSVPGRSVMNVSDPILVWVDSKKKKVWWPALLIPFDILKKFSVSKELPESAGGFVKLCDCKVFDANEEPFNFFTKIDKDLSKKKAILNVFAFLNGKFPKNNKMWKSYKPVIDYVYQQYFSHVEVDTLSSQNSSSFLQNKENELIEDNKPTDNSKKKKHLRIMDDHVSFPSKRTSDIVDFSERGQCIKNFPDKVSRLHSCIDGTAQEDTQIYNVIEVKETSNTSSNVNVKGIENPKKNPVFSETDMKNSTLNIISDNEEESQITEVSKNSRKRKFPIKETIVSSSKSVSVVPGEKIYDGIFVTFYILTKFNLGKVSQIVWVDSKDDGMWWPAVLITNTITKKYNLYKSSFDKSESKVTVVYLEYPSTGLVDLEDLREFHVDAEPLPYFLNIKPNLLNLPEIKNAIDLKNGKLPSKRMWASWTNIFKEALKSIVQAPIGKKCRTETTRNRLLFSNNNDNDFEKNKKSIEDFKKTDEHINNINLDNFSAKNNFTVNEGCNLEELENVKLALQNKL